jgi:flagellar biosynthesis protein FliR
LPETFDLLHWLFEPQKLLIFVLVLSRVSSLVMSAPILGTGEVPLRIRALLALALTLLHGAACVAHELAIGFVLGMSVRILFTAFQLAGQAISQTAGLSLSEVFHPTLGAATSSISLLLYWVALAVFLVLGGHRLMLEGFLDTFHTLPLGNSAVVLLAPEALQTLLSASFEMGLRVAAPCVLALLLATLITALLSRTLPQLNMTLGLGVNSLLVLGTLTFSLGAIAWTWADLLGPSVEMVFDVLNPQ